MAGATQLSTFERARVRAFLGYPSVQANASIMLGVPAFGQPLFLVEKGMDNLLDEAVPIVRGYVAKCESIEVQLDEARERMVAEKLGEITLQVNEANMLRGELAHWAKKIADLLGCPVNPYSEVHSGGGGLAPVNSNVVQT